MFNQLNEIALATFAEPFIYKGPSGDVTLQGVFSQHDQQEAVGGVGFADRHHSLQLLQTVVEANGIAVQKAVVVNNVNYRIIDIQADTTGMATLLLRRF